MRIKERGSGIALDAMPPGRMRICLLRVSVTNYAGQFACRHQVCTVGFGTAMGKKT